MKARKMLISPTKKAGQRTKNRIRENGPVFEFVNESGSNWLFRAGEWFGWLPRKEFHVELIDSAVDKFMIDKD